MEKSKDPFSEEASKFDKEKFIQTFKKDRVENPDDESIKYLFKQHLSSNFCNCYEQLSHKMSAHIPQGKDTEKSIQLREEGNKLLAKKKHNPVIHLKIFVKYSKSIAIAQPGSEELALAFGNRSFILLHLSKLTACINDINSAIALTKSKFLKLKLLCRKMICATALKNDELKQNTWTDIKSCFEEIDENMKDSKIMQSVKNAKINLLRGSYKVPKELDPCKLSDLENANLKYDNYQECFTSTSNLSAGDIIAQVKPYVTAINQKNFYFTCSHCFKSIWSGVPCDVCFKCMYCSSECKKEAWKLYHDVELVIIPNIKSFFKSTHTSYKFQVVCRAVVMAVKDAGSVLKLKEVLKKFNEKTVESEKERTYDSIVNGGFYNLYRMPIHATALGFTKNLRTTCILLFSFIYETDFLSKNIVSLSYSDLIKNEEILFLGFLILKLLLIIDFHMIEMDLSLKCIKKADNSECKREHCCGKGAFISPIEAYLKNNCSPNADVILTNDGLVTIISLLPIKKYEEVTYPHFGDFQSCSKMRRKSNMAMVGFKCNCEACAGDWPTVKELMAEHEQNKAMACTNMYFLKEVSDVARFFMMMEDMKEKGLLLSKSDFKKMSDLIKYAAKSYGQSHIVTALGIGMLRTSFKLMHASSFDLIQTYEKCYNF